MTEKELVDFVRFYLRAYPEARDEILRVVFREAGMTEAVERFRKGVHWPGGRAAFAARLAEGILDAGYRRARKGMEE